MQDRLVRKLTFQRADGRVIHVGQWQTFKWQDRGMYPGAWVANVFDDLRSVDGPEVVAGPTESEFWLPETGEKVTLLTDEEVQERIT
ncbi:hypothetical protein AYO47_03535 [Planctomyces sp. SCGC AG-212-M04]|nr:hypothetical protein AYO47_03535 [Planctomyces sp. SCGC AG-212-M04]